VLPIAGNGRDLYAICMPNVCPMYAHDPYASCSLDSSNSWSPTQDERPETIGGRQMAMISRGFAGKAAGLFQRTSRSTTCSSQRSVYCASAIAVLIAALTCGCSWTHKLTPEPRTSGLPVVTKTPVRAGV